MSTAAASWPGDRTELIHRDAWHVYDVTQRAPLTSSEACHRIQTPNVHGRPVEEVLAHRDEDDLTQDEDPVADIADVTTSTFQGEG